VAHFEIRNAQTPGASSIGRLYIYTVAPCIFGIIFAVFMRNSKRVSVHVRRAESVRWSSLFASHQNCGSAVWNGTRHVSPFWHLTVGRWFLDFWKICGPLLRAPCYIDENRSFVCIVRISTCSKLRLAIIVMQWFVSS
jgi:hypothetical protein